MGKGTEESGSSKEEERTIDEYSRRKLKKKGKTGVKIDGSSVGFEILTAVTLNVKIVRDAVPSNVVEMYRHFAVSKCGNMTFLGDVE
jgi:hypothetical protein